MACGVAYEGHLAVRFVDFIVVGMLLRLNLLVQCVVFKGFGENTQMVSLVVFDDDERILSLV